MIKVYEFNQSTDKLVERILDDEVMQINHMILNQGDAMPVHNSNSNVYMIVIKGTVSIKFEDDPTENYECGHIINIPFGLKMNISNQHTEQLEFFVIKSPSPQFYQQ